MKLDIPRDIYTLKGRCFTLIYPKTLERSLGFSLNVCLHAKTQRPRRTKGSLFCCFPPLRAFEAFNFSTVSSAPPKLHSFTPSPSSSSSSSPRALRVKSQPGGGGAGDRAFVRGRAPDSPGVLSCDSVLAGEGCVGAHKVSSGQ